MKIIVDAFGGDNAPAAVVEGCIDALKKYPDMSVTLCGDEERIKAELEKYRYDVERVDILHAPEIISCDEQPTFAIRKKKDSSIVVGMNLVKNKEADAKKKELADAKNEAEQIINMTEKAIKDLGDKVTDSDKKEAEELIEKTKKAMEGEDAKEITEAKDKLLEKANALATKVYESTAKEGQENTTTEEAPKEDKKDDVVDAEFEEK